MLCVTYFTFSNKIVVPNGLKNSHLDFYQKIIRFFITQSKNKLDVPNRSSRGSLEVEQWTDNRTLSISVDLNPARRPKDFRSNSNTTGSLSLIMFKN